MSSEASERMKAVVDHVAGSLKAAGFRKRRHSFNRPRTERLTHVVQFQMGASNPPGANEIPGLRQNLYGKFTINIGVFSHAMQIEPRPLKGVWINEPDCQLRQRIGKVLPANRDVWWSLGEAEVADIARIAVVEHALPWLDRFSSTQAICDEYFQHGRADLGMAPNAPLSIARLLVALGDREGAVQVLRPYASASKPNHFEYVAAFAKQFGLQEALPPLTP